MLIFAAWGSLSIHVAKLYFKSDEKTRCMRDMVYLQDSILHHKQMLKFYSELQSNLCTELQPTQIVDPKKAF